jgi:hypothetical protein
VSENLGEYGSVVATVYCGPDGPVDRRRIQLTLTSAICGNQWKPELRTNGKGEWVLECAFQSISIAQARDLARDILRYLEAHP